MSFRWSGLRNCAAMVIVGAALFVAPPSALAADPPSGVSFTLSGCRLPDANNDGQPDYTLPLNGQVVCQDQVWSGGNDDYTPGNLGKSWNELDLVPYRVEVNAGNSAPATSSFTFAIVLDYEDVGKPGYDVISSPTLNAGSAASCPAPNVSDPASIATPGLGGISKSIYRLVTLNNVAQNTTCVYDFYGRLALGSSQFSGSSLHGNLALPKADAPGGITTSGIGARDVSIPVKEISPQELRSDLSASQGTSYAWEITKEASPAELNWGNTCAVDESLQNSGVVITVKWKRLQADPTGPITLIAHVYAKNPASRVITVEVTDTIYQGTTQMNLLHTANSAPTDVPANTELLVLTHTYVWSSPTSGVTQFNNVATATYTDKITGVPVPGTTEATSTATLQYSGTTLNSTATINDVETLSDVVCDGGGTSCIQFSTDAAVGASGSFDGNYVAGTKTAFPSHVSWTSDPQTGDGEVTFNKTVYVTAGTQAAGKLVDTATLTGSDGFTASTAADIDITVDAQVSLTIEKTIPNVLQNAETADFEFYVCTQEPCDADTQGVITVPIAFAAGETFKFETLQNLNPGTYYVTENPPSGWNAQDGQAVEIGLPSCSGTASFTNTFTPADAKALKTTDPAGHGEGFTFTLTGPGIQAPGIVAATDGSGTASFGDLAAEGTYTISETAKAGWQPVGDTSCTFTIDYPADAGKTKSCSFTNRYVPKIRITKTGDALSKVGDDVTYTIKLFNEGVTGDPPLDCDISDPTVGFGPLDVSLAPATSQEWTVPFTIPAGASDPFINTVTATCGAGTASASADATWETNLFQPSVSVTKTGDSLSKIGDQVTYHFNVTNTGSTDSPALKLDSVADDILGDLVGAAAGCATLAPGASCNFDVTWTVTAVDVSPADGQADDPVVNTVTVHYHPDGFPNDIAATASHQLNLFQPSIAFQKTADTQLSKVGDKVDYTLTLNNTSSTDTPDLACTITDARLGLNKQVTVAPGAGTTVQVPYTVQAGDPDPLVNNASVSCRPTGFPNVLTATGSWTVNLFQPSVSIRKTGPAFSKAGDTATYRVTIQNTSSADAPNLILSSFSDSKVPGVVPPPGCHSLSPGADCTFSYAYVVQAGDPDPLVNTATAHYNPVGFPNDITNSSSWTTDLLHPAFVVTKVCKVEPVPQAGPAVFTIVFNNRGDADLNVVPSEGAPFSVAAGGAVSYDVGIPGPFAGTVSNTVTGGVNPDGRYGLSNSYTFSASDSCDVKGKVEIVKTVSGLPPASGQTFTFEIRQGASTASSGTVLETQTTDTNGGIAFTTELVPGQTYQVCEWVFPGWNTNLAGDGPLFVPNSIIPPSLPNPNVNNLTVCTDFAVASGQTRSFTVDNTPPPGGRALTIGFWKNWASCSTSQGKGQDPMLDLALGIASATTTNPPGGLVGSAQNAGSGWPNYAPLWYLVLKGDPTSTEDNIEPAPDCRKAVNLLDKRTIDGKSKKASDPLFNMTAQLVAAQANRFIGAGISGTTITNIDRAVLLDGKYKFNGLTYSPKLTAADASLANCLATQLDNYNNNRAVSACP